MLKGMKKMNKKKMDDLIKKSQHQFLKEKKEEMNQLIKKLLYFIKKEKKEDYDILYRFFHSLKGTAGTLNLIDIANIAEEMELLLDKKEKKIYLKEKEILSLVKGTAEILILVEERMVDSLDEKKDKKNKENFTIGFQEISNNIKFTGKILIVDDDVSMLNFLENVLKNHGYEVIKFSDSEKAMTALKTEDLDLAIVDVVMPGKSGFDIYKYMLEEKIDIPMIFLTGLQEKNVKYKALREGVDYFFRKPIEPNEFLSRIEGIMKKQRKVALEVFTDELTGAYTRKFFAKRFEEEKHRHERQEKCFSIAFLDLDYFKEINDTHGHLFGDEVLKEFVEIIKANLRNYDEVFRYGGDEFLILFPEATGEEAYKIVERIRKSAKKKKFAISFSAGISMMKDELSMTDLMKAADASLYIAKENGRNQTIYR